MNRPTRTRALTAPVTALAGAALLVTAAVPAQSAAPTITSTAVAAPAAARPAPYRATSADIRIKSALTARATTARVGAAFTGAVVDAASNTVVWSKNGNTARMPASTTKLITATNALTTFGPAHRFTTTVKAGPAADQVILVGSGDPALSSTQVAALARSTAVKLKAKHRTAVRVYYDDSLFPAPSRATGWKTSYVPADTTWLRALVVDGRDVNDTSLDAGRIFTAKLKANGITVTRLGRGKAAVKAPVLASSAGAPLSVIVSSMLNRSDNEYAEALHRLVGLRTGHGGTWSAARTAQARALAKQGLSVTALYDGSGLSRSDRITGIQLARVVANAFEPGNRTSLATLRTNAGLPVSGKTGTLRASYGRFTTPATKCAVGKVHAKTGTLNDAASLSGWAVGRDGRVKTFAFVSNGKTANLALKQNLDLLAATVTGCV